MIATLPLDDIRIGERHRIDLGDIPALAKSIELNGLLHPPVVTSENELVCGARRIAAVRSLGWKTVDVRTVNPDDMLTAERDENEVRKDFTPSERVAIARAIEDRIGERRGRPAAEIASEGNPQNIAEIRPGQETRDIAAKRAGFGNRETYRQAAKVVDHGTPTLVEAMDKGEVSIAAAAEVASLPDTLQAAVAADGPEAIQAKAVELRVERMVRDDLRTLKPVLTPHPETPARPPLPGQRELFEPEARPAKTEAQLYHEAYLRWSDIFAELVMKAASIEKIGGLAYIARPWDKHQVAAELENLRILHAKIGTFISQLQERES